jgi:dienelactone hydrolase
MRSAELVDPRPLGRRVAGNGLVANFYPAPSAARSPGILLLGGSEGGLSTGVTMIAEALQSAGFAVLHQCYFRGPDQSDALARIPLEGFGDALGWLAREPTVDGARLALVGGSKGAEAALILASRGILVRAVVAGMPSDVVWQGLSWAGAAAGSSWTEGGSELPAMPFGRFVPPNLSSVYDVDSDQRAAHRDAIIPIEKSQARFLLVCGAKDTLWPSHSMAERLQERAPHTVTVLTYTDAGHAVFGPPAPVGAPPNPALTAFGGTAEANQAARADGWPKVIGFLRANLSNDAHL